MFVPIIPVVPHTTNTTVVNKTIVYSDTVLPVKDLGGNLKVNTISDVSEYSLERCLKIIFESNPNVIFNTIQYSKNEEKIYFYTNKEISTKAWKDSKVSTYKPLTKSSEILEEIKNLLVSEPNKDNDCISLYDIAQLIKRKNTEYERDKHSCDNHFDYVISSKYLSSSRIVVYDFDYDKSELRIGFKYKKDYDDIIFAKEDEDLYLKESESYRGKEILVELGDSLSKLYDKFIQYRDFKKQSLYGFKSVNSNFLVAVNAYEVSIFVRKFLNAFRLASTNYNDNYFYDCNSNTVISALKGKESEIFKRIFVRITDCPKWSQPILYEMRQNQLIEEKKLEEEKLREKQKIEEETQRKEAKKQKRLELTRKIFPFLNK